MIVAVIVGSVAKMGKHLEGYYDLLAAVDKLGVLFDLPIERQLGNSVLPDQGPATVVVKDLDLESPGRPAADSIHLLIPAQARLCLPDEGSGVNSALLDHLFGLRQPVQGHILINGIDLRDLQPDALRTQVALVRDIEMFSGTIAENVHLQDPRISTGDIHASIEAVGLLDDLLQLPDGLETRVTERGEPLSANQAIRLMFARAIARQPKLLLIDKALDSLPDGQCAALSSWLASEERPWTLVVATGRQAVVDAIQNPGLAVSETAGGRT
jgi:ABC-type multidrug transport system fused ATPase/permease subunit